MPKPPKSPGGDFARTAFFFTTEETELHGVFSGHVHLF